MPSPTVSDHLRPTDAEVPDGVYRVVGTGDATVTLLRVGDADARRVHTGEVVTVAREDLADFEPAANPDENRSLVARVGSVPSHLYWSVRAFGRQVRASPLSAAVVFATLLVGSLGDAAVSAPDVVFDALVVVGVAGVALLGSGRL